MIEWLSKILRRILLHVWTKLQCRYLNDAQHNLMNTMKTPVYFSTFYGFFDCVEFLVVEISHHQQRYFFLLFFSHKEYIFFDLLQFLSFSCLTFFSLSRYQLNQTSFLLSIRLDFDKTSCYEVYFSNQRKNNMKAMPRS